MTAINSKHLEIIKKAMRKHHGISFSMCIYHSRKNLTVDDLDWIMKKWIKMIEGKGWYSGGGGQIIDLNESGDEAYISPKHIYQLPSEKVDKIRERKRKKKK